MSLIFSRATRDDDFFEKNEVKGPKKYAKEGCRQKRLELNDDTTKLEQRRESVANPIDDTKNDADKKRRTFVVVHHFVATQPFVVLFLSRDMTMRFLFLDAQNACVFWGGVFLGYQFCRKKKKLVPYLRHHYHHPSSQK